MLNIHKLRSLINKNISEIVPLDLIVYSLRTVTNKEDYSHITIDIKYIEIDRSIRNKGIGKTILKKMIETLFENNVDCIVITASDSFGTDFNKLVCLYKSVGFKEIKGGITGNMYMINEKSINSVQLLAEHDIIKFSRLQQESLSN